MAQIPENRQGKHSNAPQQRSKKKLNASASKKSRTRKNPDDFFKSGSNNNPIESTDNTQPNSINVQYSEHYVQHTQIVPNNTQQTYRLTKAQRDARRRHAREIKRRKRNRRYLTSLIFIVLLIGAFFIIKNLSGSSDVIPEDQLDIVDIEEDDDEEKDYNGPTIATILFAGDISTSADQVTAATRSDSTYDFSSSFSGVSSYIENSDYAVANFETTMVDSLSYGTDPYYNAPIQLAGNLRKLGFRLMSTANTHMIDNGIDGLNSTIDYLTTARLKHVGSYKTEEERNNNGGAYIRTIHGIKFAFLSYTKGTDSVYLPDGCEYALNTLYTDYADYWSDLRTSQIRSDVAAAKDAGAEVVIALVHWGSEYSRSISSLQEEAKDALLSAGVDVIIGTHSHIVNQMGFEKVEQADGTNKNCFVAYGIGDFFTDPEKEYGCTSLLLNLTFTKDRYGVITIEPSYIPIYQYIQSNGGKKTYQVLDTYETIAKLVEIEEPSSSDAQLFNNLLDSLDTLHTYAGTDIDCGPDASIVTAINEAYETGPYSDDYIQSKKDEEAAAKRTAATTTSSSPQTSEQPSATQTP